jgi:ubiquinone/menaquinone biosynthesis C-methylase UbiE
MLKKLIAKDHREAYHLWATHFDDPALMTNRDAETTRRKIENLASQLPLETTSSVLDVGPGDGALFRAIAARVRRCCGVDPSANAVSKLTGLFRGFPNVEFVVGAADAVPFPDREFDVVVINSVLQVLPSVTDIQRSLGELVRVCRPGGLVYVGELPFRSELGRGILVHVARRVYEFGARNFLRNVYFTHARPLLRGDPIVLYPATSLHVSEEEFTAMCHDLDLRVECRRHQELSRPSYTRNDYLLTLPA